MQQGQAPVDVSTIVVSYNTRELTKDCLASIFDKAAGVDFEVIVVDNASADGSAEMVRTRFPHVLLIESDKNLGFGAANNVAIHRARGKYIFLLNPDTVLLNNAIRIFFEFMEDEKNRKVGAVGGHLVDERGRPRHSCGRFAAARDFNWDVAGIRRRYREVKKLLTRRPGQETRTRPEPRLLQPEAPGLRTRPPEPVDYVTGADLFLRRSVLDKIGVFDERFFLYAEEMDLQYRMSVAGYQRAVIAGPEIVHRLSRSVNRAAKLKLLESAKLEFLKKHFPLKYAACRLARSLASHPGNAAGS